MQGAIEGMSSSLSLPVCGFIFTIFWKKAEISICPSFSFSSDGMKQKSALNACFTIGSPMVGNPTISFVLVETHTVPSSVCSKSIAPGTGV